MGTPNRLNPLAGEANPLPPVESLAADQTFFVSVGPPEASLSVSIVETPVAAGNPRGTVLVLHGIYARSLTMLHTARELARGGYRAVLVDLRGHGRSTGDYLAFGTQEAKDLSQVIDALQARGLAGGTVGAYGVSYGATTSIHLAGIDPRVRAVVAVEPFGILRREVKHFGQTMTLGVGMLIPDATYRDVTNEGGQLGRFDPDASDAIDAIRRTSAQVLLIHGMNDWIVPYDNSVQLNAAAADHSKLVSIPWLGHTALWMDPGNNLAARACEWFDCWLTSDAAVP